MIGCLMGLQPESADGTYRGGMQRPSYINLNRDFPFFVQANTIIYLFNLLCNDLINFKACTIERLSTHFGAST